MATPKSSKPLPAENSSWRIGFLLLTVITALLFIGEAVLLELARQAALQLNSQYLTIHVANSYLPITTGTWAVGTWLSMYIVLGCTHPTRKPNYWSLVSFGSMVCVLLAFIWFQRTLLYANLDYGTAPPLFPLDIAWLDLPLNIELSLIFSIFIGFTGGFFWYKWLRPLSAVSTLEKTSSPGSS